MSTALIVLFNCLSFAAGACCVAAIGVSDRRRGVLATCSLAAAGSIFLLVLYYRPNVFGLMQLAAWVIFVQLPVLLLGAAIAFRRSPAIASTMTVLALAIVGGGVDAFFIEPRGLETTRFRLESEKLGRPIRIGIVADLQTDEPGDHEIEALRRVMAEKPDLILFPGDYLQVRRSEYAEHAQVLNEILRDSGLHAPLGVFAVEGNTDYSDLWPTVFSGLPVTTMARTSSLVTGGIRVTGLGLVDSFTPAASIPENEGFHVVFGHAPDFALGDVAADVLVAGHTHGGQVRLPWVGPLITFSRVPRAWAAGMTRLSNGRTLVVSRGIGMERGQAPRLRFLCRPEVVILDVIPKATPRGEPPRHRS